MLILPMPSTSFEEVVVTLSGDTFTFTYRFNDRSSIWKLDIADSAGNPIINGVSIKEESDLTSYISSLTSWEGLVSCIKLDNGEGRVGRDNLGLGLTHELTYITYEEIENAGST